jgi:hypothetical protein
VEFLPQTPGDTVCHRVNHVIVDLIRNLVGEMRRSVQDALARECAGVLGAEKHRQSSYGENLSFHLLSLLYYID